MKIGNTTPKGIVEPTEMGHLYDKVRFLLSEQVTLWNDEQRSRLIRYSRLQRCLTEAEANDICGMYEIFKERK
jgi:hypothetical protein